MVTDNAEQTKIRDAILRAVNAVPSIYLREGCKLTIDMDPRGIKMEVNSEVVLPAAIPSIDIGKDAPFNQFVNACGPSDGNGKVG